MSRRGWIRAAVVMAAVIAGPRAALAQTPPADGDEVALRNGGIVRGTVVSMDPGKEVVVVVQGVGETRRIPWAEVDRVNRGESASATAVSSGRADAQQGTVPVTIRSASDTTELQIGRFEGGEDAVGVAFDGSASVFRDRCTPLCATTPCTLQLPPGKARLCTSQAGWVPHHSVDLNVPPTGADVSLRPFAEKPYLAGFFLSLSGAVFTVVGAVVIGAWAVGPSPTNTKMVVGSVGMGIGGGLLAVGIPLAVLSGREGVASLKPKGGGQPTAQISLGLSGLSGTF